MAKTHAVDAKRQDHSGISNTKARQLLAAGVPYDEAVAQLSRQYPQMDEFGLQLTVAAARAELADESAGGSSKPAELPGGGCPSEGGGGWDEEKAAASYPPSGKRSPAATPEKKTLPKVDLSESDAEAQAIAEIAPMVPSAQELLAQGLKTDEVRTRLAQQYPDMSAPRIGACIMYARAEMQQPTESTANGSAAAAGKASTVQPATKPAETNSPEPQGPIQGALDPRLGRYRSPAGWLPAGELPAKVTIPVKLASHAWLFSATRLATHRVELKDGVIEVGGEIVDADGVTRTCASLVVEHLRLLIALYAEAQAGGLLYSSWNGKPYLLVETTFARLHNLCTPDCAYGGSSRQRIKCQLDELCYTPVVFREQGAAIGENHRFVQEWREEEGGKITVALGTHWSLPFTRKDETKPLLFDVFRSIPTDTCKIVYVFLDYTLSKNNRTDLLLETILERIGSTEKLRRYASSQKWRLDNLWHLDGLPISNGQNMRVFIDEGQKPTNRTASAPKLVVSSKEEVPRRKGDKPTPPAPVLSLKFFQRAQARWNETPRAKRLHEIATQPKEVAATAATAAG